MDTPVLDLDETTDASDHPAALAVAAVSSEPITACAVVLRGDGRAALETLSLLPVEAGDVVVDVEVSGVSTGTEKLFWSGKMPPFPGMAYPLVPGYETVGKVVRSDGDPSLLGQRVFVPGARCYKDAHGLFGGAAERLVVPAAKVHSVGRLDADEAAMLSLAATAVHALNGFRPPDLIVGFGVLGRLLYRLTVALGHPAPTVWEIEPARQVGEGVTATSADEDTRKDYRAIYDVSGSETVLNTLISRLAPGGEVVLAGFYPGSINFAFAPAFLKEARLRIAAEWSPQDLALLMKLIGNGDVSLRGLVTHRAQPDDVEAAYRTAFTDPQCLKMLLDWRNCRG